MAIKSVEFDQHEQDLSRLVDGELDPEAVAGLVSEWRNDASLRERWHNYQLIGDVLRSDALASTAEHDSVFLAALRRRLDSEPTVLAPTVIAESSSSPSPQAPMVGTVRPMPVQRVRHRSCRRRRRRRLWSGTD